MPERSVTTIFLEFSRVRLVEQYWPRMRKAVESLSDEQVWWRPNEASNSVGNLILHLNGNVTQWMIASFNGQEDSRNRLAEFAERERVPSAALLDKLGRTLQRVAETLDRLTETDLLTNYEIQGYTVSGLQAVYQVVEHFAMHYGQILYITKLLRGEDLAFFRELDQPRRGPAQRSQP
jgi:uncharacterized damage-inducible protein DinB